MADNEKASEKIDEGSEGQKNGVAPIKNQVEAIISARINHQNLV